MNKKTILTLCALITASGCSIKSSYIQSDAPTFKAEDANTVLVYANDKPNFKYTVIGTVLVDVMGDGNKAIAELKIKAASMGANAVIHTRLNKIVSYADRTGISGIAVHKN